MWCTLWHNFTRSCEKAITTPMETVSNRIKAQHMIALHGWSVNINKCCKYTTIWRHVQHCSDHFCQVHKLKIATACRVLSVKQQLHFHVKVRSTFVNPYNIHTAFVPCRVCKLCLVFDDIKTTMAFDNRSKFRMLWELKRLLVMCYHSEHH